MKNIDLFPPNFQNASATPISVTKLGKNSYWITIKNNENGDTAMKRISEEFYNDFIKESERNKIKYKQ